MCRILWLPFLVAGGLLAVTANTRSDADQGDDGSWTVDFPVDKDELQTTGRHEGAWLAGVNDAKFGLMIPGQVLLRARYYQEIAPKVAMDRCEIVSMNETVKTPAGDFKNCLKVEETTPLEPGNKEYKYYAAGVGLVQDGGLKLVKSGQD
ncbi:MAG: hypothetical protein HY000_13360 [Planctomycetes bacterium]|nr:hypothetical protein [Planctomycetota bacterium]